MTTIFSAGTDQQQILCDIATLHNDGQPFQVDLTYGSGSFWTGVAEPLKPAIRMDLTPVWKATKGNPESESTDVNIQADVRKLPFATGSVQSVVFDPPFIHAAGKDSIMGQRFGSYPSQRALKQMYWGALMEIQRCLVASGLVVFKCQDIVESGEQCWNHLDIMSNLRSCGIPVIDLFILVKKGQLVGHNHANQQHARRNHCYFVVARKSRPISPVPLKVAVGAAAAATSARAQP